ncbi:hypothetical protein [Polyangium sorediatum]|uniref:Uncharacterized protein n=1 Tax=Polyangium sorediatum TaxID=889274 RepID=A0ABT6NSW7_9BACT|nr:hypothetical protein [Polyangium sorediatum]MDI1431421.1 hypothetical protein [Polyangium sorediatum]
MTNRIDVQRVLFTGPSGLSARIAIEKDDTGRPEAVVTTSGGAKEKSKRFKHSGYYSELMYETALDFVIDKALVHLSKQRFIVKPPQDGALDFLFPTDVGPSTTNAFAVDEARGCAWIGDWGVLRRVDLASGEIRDLSLGDYRDIRDVIVDVDGRVLIHALRAEPAKGMWLPPLPPGSSTKQGILRSDGSELEILVTADGRLHGAIDPPACSLALASSGSAGAGAFVGPHDEGLGLYDRAGELLRRFSVKAQGTSNAAGAIDPDGGFVVVTSADGKLTRHDLQRGDETTLRGDFAEARQLAVLADGTTLVLGADYDIHCIGPHGPSGKLGVRATQFSITPDRQSVVVAQHPQVVTMIDIATGNARFELTTIGADKPSRAMVVGNHVYARGLLFHRMALPRNGYGAVVS